MTYVTINCWSFFYSKRNAAANATGVIPGEVTKAIAHAAYRAMRQISLAKMIFGWHYNQTTILLWIRIYWTAVVKLVVSWNVTIHVKQIPLNWKRYENELLLLVWFCCCCCCHIFDTFGNWIFVVENRREATWWIYCWFEALTSLVTRSWGSTQPIPNRFRCHKNERLWIGKATEKEFGKWKKIQFYLLNTSFIVSLLVISYEHIP